MSLIKCFAFVLAVETPQGIVNQEQLCWHVKSSGRNIFETMSGLKACIAKIFMKLQGWIKKRFYQKKKKNTTDNDHVHWFKFTSVLNLFKTPAEALQFRKGIKYIVFTAQQWRESWWRIKLYDFSLCQSSIQKYSKAHCAKWAIPHPPSSLLGECIHLSSHTCSPFGANFATVSEIRKAAIETQINIPKYTHTYKNTITPNTSYIVEMSIMLLPWKRLCNNESLWGRGQSTPT